MANVLITGAARGIGQELTRQYAANGDRVYACCRNPGGADVLNEMAAASDGQISVHDMDVSSEDSINACAASPRQVVTTVTILRAICSHTMLVFSDFALHNGFYIKSILISQQQCISQHISQFFSNPLFIAIP